MHTNGRSCSIATSAMSAWVPSPPAAPSASAPRGDGVAGERLEVVARVQDHGLDPAPPASPARSNFSALPPPDFGFIRSTGRSGRGATTPGVGASASAALVRPERERREHRRHDGERGHEEQTGDGVGGDEHPRDADHGEHGDDRRRDADRAAAGDHEPRRDRADDRQQPRDDQRPEVAEQERHHRDHRGDVREEREPRRRRAGGRSEPSCSSTGPGAIRPRPRSPTRRRPGRRRASSSATRRSRR